MKMNFEQFLVDKHATEYRYLDDDMPDAFSDWLIELQTDDLIKYGDEYAHSSILRVAKGLVVKNWWTSEARTDFQKGWDGYNQEILNRIKELETPK